MRAARGLAVAIALFAGAAAAQQTGGAEPGPQAPVQSAVLTVDIDALFARTMFGRRINDELRAATEALAAENRRIEAELTAEEQDLTRRRPTMDPEAFRAEAQAFDAKVQAIRQERDAEERALQTRFAAGRDAFLQAATPILAALLRDAGAVVILDRRTVLVAVSAIDVTDEAAAAIDAAIGDGLALPAPQPDPPPGGGE